MSKRGDGMSGMGGGGDFDADGYAITQRGYDQLLQENQEKIDEWLRGRKASSIEIDGHIFERYTMKKMKDIVKEYVWGGIPEGDGIGIVYKNGKGHYYTDDIDYDSIKWSNVSTIYWSNEVTEAYAGSSKTITITPYNNTFELYQHYGDLDYRMDF